MSNTDDRIVNSEGAPFGPILAGILRDELESVREDAETSDAYRLAAILDMAAGYIEAVVEGKGPDSARIARLEAALRDAADLLDGAAYVFADHAAIRDKAECEGLVDGFTRGADTARAVLDEARNTTQGGEAK